MCLGLPPFLTLSDVPAIGLYANPENCVPLVGCSGVCAVLCILYLPVYSERLPSVDRRCPLVLHLASHNGRRGQVNMTSIDCRSGLHFKFHFPWIFWVRWRKSARQRTISPLGILPRRKFRLPSYGLSTPSSLLPDVLMMGVFSLWKTVQR